MSGYRTHFTTAAGCGLLLIIATEHTTPWWTWLSLMNIARIVASILGGLFPDIDIKSKGQQLLYAIVIPLLVASLLAKKIVFSILLSALGILPPLLPHRGITHQVWFSLIAPLTGPLLVYVYCPQFINIAFDLYWFFVVGILSHLVLDYGFVALLSRSLSALLPHPKPPKKRK